MRRLLGLERGEKITFFKLVVVDEEEVDRLIKQGVDVGINLPAFECSLR